MFSPGKALNKNVTGFIYFKCLLQNSPPLNSKYNSFSHNSDYGSNNDCPLVKYLYNPHTVLCIFFTNP